MNENFNRISYLEAKKPIMHKLRKFIPVKKTDLIPLIDMEKSCTQETHKVYLRIKPFNRFTNSIFTVESSSTLTAQLHKESTCQSNRNGNMINHQYKFTEIFGPNTTQKQLFRETCLEPLQKFISGEDCLLFAYGATNAGKTYTIQGNTQQPGIIPQALNMIFTTLKGRLRNDCRFKPCLVNSVEELDELAQAEEINLREKILDFPINELSKAIETPSLNRLKVDKIYSSPQFQAMKSHLEEVIIKLDPETTVEYYLWVSFFEIHNECIYDLLEQTVVDGKRKNLSLISADGGSYVKDLKHVCVTSADEAFHVYMFGKNNLKTAFTNLNSVSSRSHSIFSLKMVCLNRTNEKVIPRVGVFSCVDLAGTERAKKTNNEGLRLKESQNINNSLLVLGRCLTVIRQNQKSKDRMVVPYRDSKLTRVFQHALTGQQCVTMIVNVNFDPKMNKETLNALKFSAIAREIVVRPIKTELDSTFVQHTSKTCCDHLKEIINMQKQKISNLLEAQKKIEEQLNHELSNRLHEEMSKANCMNQVSQLEKIKTFYRTAAINMEEENDKLKRQVDQLTIKQAEVCKENSDLKVHLAALNRKLSVYELISSSSNENTASLENKLKELLSELEDRDEKIEKMSRELNAVKSNTVILENELKTMETVVRESCDMVVVSDGSDSESLLSYESENDCGESDEDSTTRNSDVSVEVIDLDDSL